VNKLRKAKQVGDEDDVKAGKIWLEKIDMGIKTTETEDLGMAVLGELGLETFNPYYPDLSK